VADKDLRHCPFCGRCFIENATYDAPLRCPQCGHEVTAALSEVPSEAEAVLFEEFILDASA